MKAIGNSNRYAVKEQPLKSVAALLLHKNNSITICGQTAILTSGELATALLSLPEYDRISNP